MTQREKAETFRALHDGPAFVIVNLAEPEIADGQVVVVATSWCGGLCGTGGAFVVAQGDDGVWHVTGTYGPQWEA